LLKNKKILALVPARGGSKGIKNKNLKLINKKPLIQYTLDFINSLKFIDLKIVSSDSQKILNFALKNNFAAFKRPKKYAGDRVSDYEVIKSVIDNHDIKKNNYDYLIYLQPTSPYRKKKNLVDTLKKIISQKYYSAWSVTKIDKKNHPFKILKINKKKLNLFDKRGLKIIARQQLEDIYIRNGVFYIFSIKKLNKYKSIYMKKTLPVEINHEVVNIDSLSDLKKAKKIFS
jgi:CMP-N,N'-diacetyllegionaminic acid synthase